MPVGSPATEEVNALYLYESAKAVKVLLVDGSTKWLPLQYIHGEWNRSTESWQVFIVESNFMYCICNYEEMW